MVKLLLAYLLALFWSAPVEAQTGCQNFYFSWTTPYQGGSIQAVSYNVDYNYMSVLFRSQAIELDVNVPLSVAQASTKNTQTADSWYTTQVKGRYQQSVLVEVSGCPLLNEATGQFITAG